jgi:hypothetical protein
MKKNKLITIIVCAIAALLIIGTVILLACSARFKYQLNDSGDGYVITQYKGWKKTVNIPSTKRGLPVVAIGPEAFAGNSKIKTVNIHGDIEKIDFKAFAGCENLVNVNMEDGVKSIGVSAFGDCTSLFEIRLPEGVTVVMSAAFRNCTRLSTVSLPSTLENINYLAFIDCGSLSNLTVDADNPHLHSVDNCLIETESGILLIGTNTSVIPDDGSVVTVGEGAFSGKVGLRSIVIPSAVSTVMSSAFENCPQLQSVDMSGVEKIGERAFFGCKRLSTVIIGRDLESVEPIAFHGCTALKDLYYIGSSELFSLIELGENNLPFNNAKLHLYSENKPEGEGSFWHYDEDGEPVIW